MPQMVYHRAHILDDILKVNLISFVIFVKISLFRTWAFIAVCRQCSDNDSQKTVL